MTEVPRDFDGALVPLYEEVHEQRPVVTILCGADGGRCRKRLGRVWATRGGLLVHYVRHVAPLRFNVDTGNLTEEKLAALLASGESGLGRYEPGQPTGIGDGLRDDDGCLALLDHKFYRHSPEVGCLTHDGIIEIARDELLEAALAAVRRGRPAELVLRR